MWSNFLASLKLTEILNIFLINWNLDTFRSISVFFEGEKMVDYILEIPGLVVFGVKCFNCNTVILLNSIYEIIPLRKKTI